MRLCKVSTFLESRQHQLPPMDIILTGIARSGTTLTCALLNKLPQTVALIEPMDPTELVGLDYPTVYLDQVGKFFATQRASLMSTGSANTKARDGKVPENPFPERGDLTGLRRSSVRNQHIRFGKNLREGFRLAAKHPTLFTANPAALLSR